MRSIRLPLIASRMAFGYRGYCVFSASPNRLLGGSLGHDNPLHCRPTVPPQHYHLLPTPHLHHLAKSSDLSTQKFTLIYRFKTIKSLRVISRFKLFQTGVTVLLVPLVYYLFYTGQTSLTVVSYVAGIAAFAAIMLIIISHCIRRVVGMMYVDSSCTTLKVSHLTFWGRRHDVYLPVSDIMPIQYTGDAAGEIILRLKRYSDSKTLYFSPHFGQVVDRQAFENVFGSSS